MANNQVNLPQFNTRTIDDFKSRLVGGGSRSNLFECILTFPPALGISPDEDFRMMVKAAQIPGSTVGTIPIPFRGRTLKVAGDKTFDPWMITVINDTNFKIRNAFEKWSNLINRHQDAAGVITPNAYQFDMIVLQLGRGVVANNISSATPPTTGSTIPVLKTYLMSGAWPSDISPMDVSYDSTDQVQEFSVTFQYQWWDTYESNNGVPTNNSMLGSST